MSVTNKSKAKSIKAKNDKLKGFQLEVQSEVSQAFYKMLDDFHKMNIRNDNKLDLELLNDEIQQITSGRKSLRGTWNDALPTFSPSGADSCERSLAFKILKAEEDDQEFEPYQKRWVRNGSAIHKAMQRDLIYIEKYLPNAPFAVCRTKDGKFGWERNTRTVRTFEHNGEKFQLYGMVDAMLLDKTRNKRIGYDFKTKSTTIASVGDYMLKVPQESNVLQMVAYSILFDVDEYLIHYESLAKDSWTKGKEARNDMKVFHIKISEQMKTELLDKLAGITKQIREDQLPNPDFGKCLFCKFKEVCSEVEKGELE
jgi:CRISPR/Cas system-associated exonuclease Cas4 (RecB family)